MKRPIAVSLLILIIMFFYLLTLPPVFKYNDSPETITDSYRLGIQHPPGYPLFTMAGKIAALLPLGSVAFRVNILSALLAMLLLLVSYFIFERISPGNAPGTGDKISRAPLSFWGVAITAVSYMIWNQGIEAKGGIYILNLLLAAVIVYSSLRLAEGPCLKYLYLIFFAFGLSLSNQWPSAIITGPIVLYEALKAWRGLNIRKAGILLLLLCAGLSAYIYLPMRMHATGAAPTWENFWWFAGRSPYLPGFSGRPDLAKHAAWALKIIFTDLSMLLAFALPGFIYLFRNKRKAFYVLLYIIASDTAAAVAYNAYKSESFFIMSTFFLPAVYAGAVVSASGVYYTLNLLRGKMRAACAAVTALAVLFIGWSNFDRNNFSGDYLAYDYGRNILKTMDAGPVYLAAGDINILPLYYLTLVEKKRPDVEMITAVSLNFSTGCDGLMAAHPGLRLAPGQAGPDILEIIRYFSGKRNIYACGLEPGVLSAVDLRQNGLLRSRAGITNNLVFERYSYRGMHERYNVDTGNSAVIISGYIEALKAASLEEIKKGNKTGALRLYRKSMLLPGPATY